MVEYLCKDCNDRVTVDDEATIIKRKKLCLPCLANDFQNRNSGILKANGGINILARTKIAQPVTRGRRTLHQYKCRECEHVTGLLSIVPKSCPKCLSNVIIKVKNKTTGVTRD